MPDNDLTVAQAHAPVRYLRAILPDGSLVAPGTAGTLKYDASGAAGSGNPILSDVVASRSDGSTSASRRYNTASATVAVPAIAKLLGLYPYVATMTRGNLYMRNAGERLPIRGGGWANGGGGGVFALSLDNARSRVDATVGFRPAFVA